MTIQMYVTGQIFREIYFGYKILKMRIQCLLKNAKTDKFPVPLERGDEG